jgi:hypothetical protein
MDRLVLRREFLEAQLGSLQDIAELAGICAKGRKGGREGGRQTLLGINIHNGGSWARSSHRRCITLCIVTALLPPVFAAPTAFTYFIGCGR